MFNILVAVVITFYVATGYRFLVARSKMKNSQQKTNTNIMGIMLLVGLFLLQMSVSALNFWETKLTFYNTTDELVDPADIALAATNAHMNLFVLAVLLPVALLFINAVMPKAQTTETTVEEEVSETSAVSPIKEEQPVAV